MSFHELPIVDDNAKASEESVLAVRAFFSQRNGFISHEESPDYGVDLEVQLIVNGNEASSKKFPVQIKSSSSFKTVQIGNEVFISRPFLTSRLNYLCERPPTYGLIIFYDENENSCYYEFTEKVVQKITTDRGNDDWKSQKSINIHISKSNRLNAESVASIHQQFNNRFEAQKLLIQNHGHRYEIPSFSRPVPGNETSQLQPAEILKKYGLLFINEDNIHFLYELLGKVSMHEILVSKDLTFIAGVVYGEMGKCMEADLFLNKAFQKIDQYDEVQSETLKFVRIKVDFLFGRLSREQYINDLKSATEGTKNKFNALLLRINLTNYAIIQKIESQQLDYQLESDIIELFSVISDAKINEEQKLSLKVFQAENLHLYISNNMLQWIKQLKIKESLNVYVSQADRNQMFVKSNDLIRLATQEALVARSYALQKSKKALQAHAEYALARFYYFKQYAYLLLHFQDNKPDKERNFRRTIDFAISARKIFLELGLLNETRLALICVYNIKRLSKLYYGMDIQVEHETDESLLNSIYQLNQEIGITTSFVSEVERAHAEFVQRTSKEGKSVLFNDMSDEEITNHAKTVLGAYQLPEDRLVNIVGEMKAYKYFESNVNTDNYELLTSPNHHDSQENLYTSPSSYIIRSKKTGMHSLPSLDIVKLATEFGALRESWPRPCL